MTKLNTVTVNEDHTVASVGAGASWLDVYAHLDALNLSVAGGRNGAVGVGGLTLGGGISYFAPRVGWACDNVANFEVRWLERSGKSGTDTPNRSCLRPDALQISMRPPRLISSAHSKEERTILES